MRSSGKSSSMLCLEQNKYIIFETLDKLQHFSTTFNYSCLHQNDTGNESYLGIEKKIDGGISINFVMLFDTVSNEILLSKIGHHRMVYVLRIYPISIYDY